MDLTQTILPNSDQVNADDFMAGEQTVTITGVEAGSSEQPVFVHLAEFPGRTYRPSKSMRRVLVAAWGKSADVYVGRRMTLYRDPEVTFGRDKVGGIKIGAVSHIEKPLAISLTATRGRRAPHTVQPLIEEARPDYATQVAEATTKGALNGIWSQAARAGHLDDTLKAAILARGGELVDDTQEGDQ